jgi:hypothetical protein
MALLSRTALNEYYVQIGNGLPPPVNPTPELRQRRFTTAVETFNDLRPGTAYEALLAVKVVLCGAHGIDALREAGVYREDFAKMTRCRAQASSMMREERAAKRKLEQEQKVRLAVEAVAGSARVQPAIASAPPQQAEPQAAPPPVEAATPAPRMAPVDARVDAALDAASEAPATLAVDAPETGAGAAPPATPPHRPAEGMPAPQPAGEKSAPPPSPEAIAKAETYAAENIVAAAQIRFDRGVTPLNTAYLRHLTLPTDPELIDALVRGTSTVLSVLDEIGGEDLENAA